MADIYKLSLSTRALNCLRRARIETIADLSRCSDEQLMSIRGMGVTILAEIRGKLQEYDDEQTLDDLKSQPIPKIRSAEDYAIGVNAMRLEVLRLLDDLTVTSSGQRWLIMREVSRLVRRLEVP